MNVDLDGLKKSLEQLEERHAGELKGKSGHSPDWESGFIQGLNYVRNYVIPAFETVELDLESEAVESMQSEMDMLKFKVKHGLIEPENLDSI